MSPPRLGAALATDSCGVTHNIIASWLDKVVWFTIYQQKYIFKIFINKTTGETDDIKRKYYPKIKIGFSFEIDVIGI